MAKLKKYSHLDGENEDQVATKKKVVEKETKKEDQVAAEDAEKLLSTRKNIAMKAHYLKEDELSIDLKLDRAFMVATNEIYEHISTEYRIDLGVVEKAFIKALLEKFNQTTVAKLAGVSIKTIRNKKKQYGI